MGAAALYADVLGEQGLAEYRRLAAAAWNKLPSRSGKARAGDEGAGRYALKNILDFFAGRDGDVDARIALRANDLSSQWSYLQLAEFCLSHGRGEEALRRAEEGLRLFEDDEPDERLLFFTVKLLSKAGRKADAEAHLWRAFEKAPSLDIYKQLLEHGGPAAAGRAVALVEKRAAGKQRSARNGDANLLIGILMHDKKFDLAWSAVSKVGAAADVKQELARASDRQHPSEALEVYAAEVEVLANHGSYDEAAKVIARMKKIRNATEQAAYVADLKVRHGRKRNFMKLLG
jgi:tetratricopeptide (TPR) repeat protein